MYLKCIFIQVIEQMLGHEISRFVVKSFRRVMEVKEEVIGKRKGGRRAQEKEKELVWWAVVGWLKPSSSIRLQQEQGPRDENSPSLSFYSHSGKVHIK